MPVGAATTGILRDPGVSAHAVMFSARVEAAATLFWVELGVCIPQAICEQMKWYNQHPRFVVAPRGLHGDLGAPAVGRARVEAVRQRTAAS